MSLVTARGVLLRAHPYSESSRVLRFFTDRMGIVGVMAKGARRTGSKVAQGLDTFAEGALTLYVKDSRELQTLREFVVDRPRRGLGRDPLRLSAASVLGEIVLRHAGEADSELLFAHLAHALDRVAEAEPNAVPDVLLAGGWGLVARLGFAPVVDVCVECGEALGDDDMGRFDFAQGGLRCPRCAGDRVGPRLGPGARSQLLTLLEGEAPAGLERPRPHLQLLSDFIAYHVAGGRPLDAFRVLAALLPPDDA